MTDDQAWLKKRAAAEDGSLVSVGGLALKVEEDEKGQGEIAQKHPEIDISELRQTCRLTVKVAGEEPKDIVLRFAHQDPEGQNDRPVGEDVYFEGKWHKSKDVQVIRVLPWMG